MAPPIAAIMAWAICLGSFMSLPSLSSRPPSNLSPAKRLLRSPGPGRVAPGLRVGLFAEIGGGVPGSEPELGMSEL
ncbi:Uncharacterised protein [Mycobacteroides abscessus subsp. abscessus]|nr:Uncharacterised protein [Mycobacteroides abscessus subsp. abscessus]